MSYGVIYMITNTINGKKYIGQTTRTFNERYAGGLYKGASNLHLKNAIKKYGEENFEVNERLVTCDSKEELDKMEKCFITTFRTFEPTYGYNKTHGGEGGKFTEERRSQYSEYFKGENNPFYGRKHDEETKKKIGNRHYATREEHYLFGKSLPEETKRKISQTRLEKGVAKGENNSFYGKTHSEETKRKLIENNCNPPKQIIGINLRNFDETIIFESTKEARRNGFSNVVSVCKGKQIQCKGYKFYYHSVYISKSKEVLLKELEEAKASLLKRGERKCS